MLSMCFPKHLVLPLIIHPMKFSKFLLESPVVLRDSKVHHSCKCMNKLCIVSLSIVCVNIPLNHWARMNQNMHLNEHPITFHQTTMLWMEEILHHLGWLKPFQCWDKPSINWCRISCIHRISTYFLDTERSTFFCPKQRHKAHSAQWQVMPPMTVKRYGCAACTLGNLRHWHGWPMGIWCHGDLMSWDIICRIWHDFMMYIFCLRNYNSMDIQ